jgi:hypothetical protein
MSELDADLTDEETWHRECRIRVADYLKDQAVMHGRIGDAPA